MIKDDDLHILTKVDLKGGMSFPGRKQIDGPEEEEEEEEKNDRQRRRRQKEKNPELNYTQTTLIPFK